MDASRGAVAGLRGERIGAETLAIELDEELDEYLYCDYEDLEGCEPIGGRIFRLAIQHPVLHPKLECHRPFRYRFRESVLPEDRGTNTLSYGLNTENWILQDAVYRCYLPRTKAKGKLITHLEHALESIEKGEYEERLDFHLTAYGLFEISYIPSREGWVCDRPWSQLEPAAFRFMNRITDLGRERLQEIVTDTQRCRNAEFRPLRSHVANSVFYSACVGVVEAAAFFVDGICNLRQRRGP
ncbi:MAG: hypothetical protein WC654_06355 [Patescibacteria group bacterium]